MRSPRIPSVATPGGRPSRAAPRTAWVVALVVLALGGAGCGSDSDSIGAEVNTDVRPAVGATTAVGPPTTGTDGERTTAEGMVLPAYADGRAPTADDDAPCTAAAMRTAVRDDVEAAVDRDPSYLDCAERYAVAVVEVGDCSGDAATTTVACETRRATYWKAVGGAWRILTYVPLSDAACGVPRGAGEPAFPRSLCVPRTGG